jgi:PEP-CTERM motif-containing protein
MQLSGLRKLLTSAAGIAFVVTAFTPTAANAILVATIGGQYGSPVGDTPNLFIHNPTAFSFTNVQIKGVAYQGLNALLAAGTDIDKSDNVGLTSPFHRTQIKNLPDIAGGTDFTYSFLDGPAACGPGFSNQGDYFASDYDDTYGCSTSAQPGNVQFTFTADWNGNPIFSVFSPTTNFTGGFLGFLGLDQDGFAESIYDNGGAVAGTGQFGTLAEIFVGTPPTGVPEPSTIALLGAGIIGEGAFYRRRKAKA